MPRREPQPWKRKSDGAWYIQLDGKQRYLSTDKKTAYSKYHALLASEHKSGTAYTAQNIIDHYLQWMKANRASSTVETREPYLLDFQKSLPKTLKASQIKPHHVQAWVDRNPNWNSTTANTRITSVMAVWNWALRMCVIERNPLAHMPKPRRKVRQDYVPYERWQELLDYCTDEFFRDMIHFALLTGARATECFKFQAEHYDETKLVLPIEDSKGNRSSRVVFLGEDANRIVLGNYAWWGGEGHIFRNLKGVPWNKDSVRQRFRRLKTKMKMPGLCMTTLRHSFAAHRLSSGQDSATVAALMGHCDTRMLLTRYGHLTQQQEYMTEAANFASKA